MVSNEEPDSQLAFLTFYLEHDISFLYSWNKRLLLVCNKYKATPYFDIWINTALQFIACVRLVGSSKFRGGTASNKEYSKIFPLQKNMKYSAVLLQILLDPAFVSKITVKQHFCDISIPISKQFLCCHKKYPSRTIWQAIIAKNKQFHADKSCLYSIWCVCEWFSHV